MATAATRRLSRRQILTSLRAAQAVSREADLLAVDEVPIGIGALADTLRLRLTWSRPGSGPASLVAKIPALDGSARATATSIGAYQREARFYRELAPRTAVRAPRCHGVLTESGEDVGVLLEDLSATHRPVDQLREVAPEILGTARRQLALLQAPFWEEPDTARLEWLHRRLGVAVPHIVDRMRRSWATTRSTIGADLAVEERACVDRFVARADSWSERLDGPHSLVHHDFRVDNLLAGPPGAGEDVPEVVVLDWQTIGWGHALFDLAYLLGTSLDSERRRLVEQDEVARHVDDLNEQGVTLTRDHAWQAYRQASYAILFMLVPPTASVKRTPRSDAMFRRLIGLGARQAIDLDAEEFLTD
jgi:Phosphotransferase enzyme family